jgi:hypothetical protein
VSYVFRKPVRPVTRVFLHCTASDYPAHDSVAVVRQWHIANGWSDIGYHLFIHRDGSVEAGRSLELTPAAQAGHNTGTIAIVCHGLTMFSPEQMAAVRALCLAIDAAYSGRVTFHGHCEVAAKACPVYDYRGVLLLDPRGVIDRQGLLHPEICPDTVADTYAADADVSVEASRTLRRGSTGDDVRWLQTQLRINAAETIVADGDFGPATEAAVKRFQIKNHLAPDGIWGPLSREAMEAVVGRA